MFTGKELFGPKVVKIRRSGGKVVQDCDVYIGRKQTQGGWSIKQDSIWHNPFKAGKGNKDPLREFQVVFDYWNWIHEPEQALLMERIPELSGKVLGCWCKVKTGDEPCHGDVLYYLSNRIMPKNLEDILRWGGIDYTKVALPPSIEEKFDLNPRVSLQRVRAGFIGLILGDALGVPHEFPKWGSPEYTGKLEHKHVHKGEQRFGRPPKTLAVGQYSDDSEMALVLARSLISKRAYDEKNVIEGYIRWANSGTPLIGKNTRELFKVNMETYKDPGGYQHYITAYKEKFNFTPLIPFSSTNEKAEEAQSNGSLMRCFPLACLWDEDAVNKDIWASNPSTVVRHMEIIYIRCLRNALRGISAHEIWKDAFEVGSRHPITSQIFTDIMTAKPNPLTENKRWIGNAFFAAMTCLGYLVSGKPTYTQLMNWVIKKHPGSDTDTNAAIAGALIGSIIGWDSMISEEGMIENIKILQASTQSDSGSDIPRQKEYQINDIEEICRDLTILSSLN